MGTLSIAVALKGLSASTRALQRRMGNLWSLRHLRAILVLNSHIKPHTKNKEVRVNPKASSGLWVVTMCQ